MARSNSKLNSTSAVRAMPVPDEDGPQSVSCSVREIDNGWVSTHTTSGSGEYKSREEYHASKPDVHELVGRPAPVVREPPSHLAQTVRLLNRGKA